MGGMMTSADEDLFALAFARDDEMLPERFLAGTDLSSIFKMVRFLAERVYMLETDRLYPE